MQSDVELGLGDNEQILAIGDKNQTLFFCAMAILTVIMLVSVSLVIFIPDTLSFASILKGLLLFDIIFVFLITKFLYESYQYNQIYITNKRLIITQKDRIEGIPFEEVQYFNSVDFDFSTLNLKSKRKFIFLCTNLDDVKNEYVKLNPAYKQPFMTLRRIIILLLILTAVILFNIPHKYLNKIQQKLTPQSYKVEKSIEITDSQSYMEYLQRTLRLNWTPPKYEQDANVVVEFNIKPDGTIFDEKVMKTSGSRELDNSALFAIRKANPLRKLPNDLLNEKDVKINFTFDYDVKNENN